MGATGSRASIRSCCICCGSGGEDRRVILALRSERQRGRVPYLGVSHGHKESPRLRPAAKELPECRRQSACPVAESTPVRLMQTGVCTPATPSPLISIRVTLFSCPWLTPASSPSEGNRSGLG